MPSPFPGMNPYLEEPSLWPAVHTNLIVSIQDALLPLLRPRYYVTVELREYAVPPTELGLVGVGDVLVGRERAPAGGPNGHAPAGSASQEAEAEPDGPGVLTVTLPAPVEVRERYLEIRRPRTHELITVLEVLSPTNKRPGKGRQQYEEKRLAIAGTHTNLVEIDLLRAGEPLPLYHDGALLPRALAGDYRVVISRGAQRHRARLYTIRLREPLPTIPIPLRPEDEEPRLDLQAIVHAVYDRGGFDLQVDYNAAPPPPLSPEDAAWAASLLRDQGLR